jgi:hypothetical protein
VPPERVFFTDRDLGRRIFPDRLREGGLRVEVHFDHFAPAAADTEWLPVVAARGWVVLSNDQKIMRRPLEREAVRISGATLIVLVGGQVPAPELATNFLNTLPKIEEPRYATEIGTAVSSLAVPPSFGGPQKVAYRSPAIRQPRRSPSQPRHIIQCPVCGQRFYRDNYDTRLRDHTVRRRRAGNAPAGPVSISG